MYLEAGVRLERERYHTYLKGTLAAVRTAHHGDSKDVQAFMKDLED